MRNLKKLVVCAVAILLVGCQTTSRSADEPKTYEAAISKWKSDKEVGAFLDRNFVFDKGRQLDNQARLRSGGPTATSILAANKLYENTRGWCADAAGFSIDALNRMNPEYKANWIFIKNAANKTNHWVAGYHQGNKLYVMDFGAGEHWSQMKGIHGPYDSLDGYKEFLASLNISNFKLEDAWWREYPGQVE